MEALTNLLQHNDLAAYYHYIVLAGILAGALLTLWAFFHRPHFFGTVMILASLGLGLGCVMAYDLGYMQVHVATSAPHQIACEVAAWALWTLWALGLCSHGKALSCNFKTLRAGGITSALCLLGVFSAALSFGQLQPRMYFTGMLAGFVSCIFALVFGLWTLIEICMASESAKKSGKPEANAGAKGNA